MINRLSTELWQLSWLGRVVQRVMYFPAVIVLTEVDQLTKDAQHALRRTMEKYMATCRLVLCCNSTSKVIPAIKSRCLGIRVPAPTNDEVAAAIYPLSVQSLANL